MPMIDVNETTLYYERTGDGPPMLFVHGMCGDADVWADQTARLSGHFSCVRYDRRGHTRSARGAAAVTAALHADDAAALIEALDLAPCLLVGSSSGAVIGVDVARRHGHLLRGAVLSEPPLFSLDRDAGDAVRRAVSPLVATATETGDRRSFVDGFFSLLCPGLWTAIDEDRKERYRDNGDIGLTDLLSPPLELTDADLAAVTIPTLVIAGSTSHPSLRSTAHRLAAVLPDARLVEMADCGHVTYAERPEEFAHAVSLFAAELHRRTAVAPT
jgi:pimeloyl-ACP methyl ester carboxylesterase